MTPSLAAFTVILLWHCLLALSFGTLFWHCLLALSFGIVFWHCPLPFSFGTLFWHSPLPLSFAILLWHSLWAVMDMKCLFSDSKEREYKHLSTPMGCFFKLPSHQPPPSELIPKWKNGNNFLWKQHHSIAGKAGLMPVG